MDERAIYASAHATRANKSRHLPSIASTHYRALQLFLSTEANDVRLTAQQRRDARTLQEHYHRQYLQDCLHKDKSPLQQTYPCSSTTTETKPQLNSGGADNNNNDNNSSSGSSKSGKNTSRRIVDRVRQNVDHALERKRRTRGFIPPILPNGADLDLYAMCLKDLASLSCEPELDALPVPDSIDTLVRRSKQNAAEAAVVEAAEKARYAQESDKAAETILDKGIAPKRTPPSVATSRDNGEFKERTLRQEPVLKPAPTTTTATTPPTLLAPTTTKADSLITTARSPAATTKVDRHTPSPPYTTNTAQPFKAPELNPNQPTLDSMFGNHATTTANGRSGANQRTNVAAVEPPSRPKYAVYDDDEEEMEQVVQPTVFEQQQQQQQQVRSNYFSNGMDRPGRKRGRNDGMDAAEGNGPRPMEFITAKEQLIIEEEQLEDRRQNQMSGQGLNRGGYTSMNNIYNTIGSGGNGSNNNTNSYNNGAGNLAGPGSLKSKMLGTKRAKFKSPMNKGPEGQEDGKSGQSRGGSGSDEPLDERLRNVDPKMIETIKNEIMERCPVVTWDDISGLEHAKTTIKEAVIWPMLRPDIFTGLRRPPKGLLLFGPPGTGKTLIGKCIASQSQATFFSISSSTLTSKWVGDGEKMVRALFAVARCHQPAVIFMDEIDSLLTQRTDGEFEASRRIKTEFLVQFDGVGTTGEEDRILLVGATNRPQEIDEAARRRFQKRLYVPLPESAGRHGMIQNLLRSQHHDLTSEQILDICERTKGYSGSDMNGLCREAALGPVRSIQGDILM
ncbi:hypothetical protein BGW38_001996, partial [Lunasporangiospora selenospora]